MYYTVLLGAQGDIPIGDEEIEISYNDIAAEAKAKMSEDPDIERAFWTTQLTGAIPTYNLDGTVQTIEDVTKDNDIEVAAEVAAIMSGEVSDYDRVKAQLEKTGPIPVYDIQVTEATAEVAQEAAAETTEAVAEVAQEAAAEVSQEVAEVAQEVSQEVAEVAQEAVKEVAEEVAKSAKDIASEIRAEVASAEKEWSDLAASGASYQEQMSAFQKYGAAVQKLSRLPQSEGGASAEK